jgi:hypothetical protein
MSSRFKTSCDFDEPLFKAFKAHCKATGKTITGALEDCMTDVLRVHGKLPGDEVSQVAAEAAELAKELGAGVVRDKLCELASVGALAAGGGR